MNRQEIEAALEADWESVVSFFHNLFHKTTINPVPEVKAQDPAPPSPVTEAPPAQVIADPVAAAPAAPSVTDRLFPGANQPGDSRAPAQVIPDGWFVMDGEMRNGRTALVYGTDNGVLFGAKPGKTTYTITIPADEQYAQALQFNKDGVKTGHENCTVSVNGVVQDVYQSGNNTVVLRTPGDYTLDVECDALFTITPNYTT